MIEEPLRRICFVGKGASAICYYRTMMPAINLGADWVGVVGKPPKLEVVTGSVKKTLKLPDFIGDDYDIIVLQQPKGESWERMIEVIQETGKKVVFEVDDYLHGVESRGGEDAGRIHGYDSRSLYLFERCMEMCDALIASTEYIAKKYRKFNPNVYVCRNGIDLNRYKLTRPKRKTINIGWSGATGHLKAMAPWMNVVHTVLVQREDTCFVSIGQNYADAIGKEVGKDRAISIPFTAIEQYPSAMTMFDIALAPGAGGSWYRGKSDLRWLEASALGIPLIARPSVYPEIEDGVTGFYATTPQQMAVPLIELLNDAELRDRVGEAAKAYVTQQRTIQHSAEEWADAFGRIAG